MIIALVPPSFSAGKERTQTFDPSVVDVRVAVKTLVFMNQFQPLINPCDQNELSRAL